MVGKQKSAGTKLRGQQTICSLNIQIIPTIGATFVGMGDV